MEQTQSVAPRPRSTDVPQEQAGKETIDSPTGSSPGPATLQRHALLDSLSGAAFKGAFEHAAIGMALVDLHGRCLAANNALCEMLGYSAEELLEQPFQPITHPDDLTHNLDLGNRLIAGEIPSYRLEKRYFHKRGHIVWVLLSTSLVRDQDGKPLYVISQIQDITERKRSEKALRASEARYRSLVNASPDAIASVDLEGRFTYVNRQFAVLIGYGDPEDMLGVSVYEHIAPEDHTVLDADFQRVLQSGTLRNVRYTMVRKDGTRIPTENSYSMIYDTAGTPAALIGVTRDISDRKRAERALRQSEERYRAIVEDQTELVCRFRPDTILTFVNEAYCRYFGTAREDLIGTSFLALLPDEDGQALLAHLASLIANPRTMTYEHEVLIPGGQRRWQEWTNRPILDDQGNVMEFQSVGRDVTDRKRAEAAEREQRILVQALRDTTAALSSTLNFEQVLDRLLANASRVVPHDAANIMLVDSRANEAYVVRARGYAERGLDEWVRRLRLPLSVASDLRRMIETGQPVVIPDVANAAQWISFPESTWLRAYAAAPIQIKGRTVGFLNFDSATPGFFTNAHVERLQAFADEAAMAIENARLFEATQHSVTRLTLLYHASVALVKAESVDALYREVLHWARRLGEASVATLALFDGKSHVVVVAADGMPQEIVGSRLALGEGLNGRTAKLRAPVQMHRYGDWDSRLLAFNDLGIVSAMGLPLIWQDQLVGTLVIAEQHGREFDDDDMHMLTLFASIVSAALEQRRAMADAQAREAEANALSARLAHAQEEERVRIAGQLHDSIGYRLVASQKNIEAALAALSQGHPLAEHLTANLKILQETHQQTRSLAMDLNSKVLADLGISPAARQYIERLANSTGMGIHLHITGRIRRLPMDVERVAYRGLQETVNNALRHAHATEISAQVHFGSRSLRLTIQDNGCGFDATSLERSANGKGTSMGLPDLRRQVEASQGTLMLESSPGQGTLVVLTLPIHVAALPDKTKQRVLVVDDHETTRQGLRVTLSQSDNFSCAGEAIDGPSAVHQVELSHPDLVIMDVALPHLNGIEAARQITKRFPHIGIVMLSYQGDEAYLDQAFHAGARGYVLKTDDGSHILAALRAVQAGNSYVSPTL
ncbi:MAG: PAS domain S-box protein, partial [Chloroflexi bacterium]|nr:PAS domain S-box protein [Chloroflexota bacterium]